MHFRVTVPSWGKRPTVVPVSMTSYGYTHACTFLGSPRRSGVRELTRCTGTGRKTQGIHLHVGLWSPGLVRTLIPEAGARHHELSGCLPFYLVPRHSFKAQASADVPARAPHRSLFHPPCSLKLPQSLLSLVFLFSFLRQFQVL